MKHVDLLKSLEFDSQLLNSQFISRFALRILCTFDKLTLTYHIKMSISIRFQSHPSFAVISNCMRAFSLLFQHAQQSAVWNAEHLSPSHSPHRRHVATICARCGQRGRSARAPTHSVRRASTQRARRRRASRNRRPRCWHKWHYEGDLYMQAGGDSLAKQRGRAHTRRTHPDTVLDATDREARGHPRLQLGECSDIGIRLRVTCAVLHPRCQLWRQSPPCPHRPPCPTTQSSFYR